MKKLFFFRSSASNNGNSNQISPPSRDKHAYWEKPTESFDKSRLKNQVSESPCLRRSLSFSSASLHRNGCGEREFGNQSNSPCSISNALQQQRHSSRRALTPERETRMNSYGLNEVQNGQRRETSDYLLPLGTRCDISDNASYSSSNVSDKVLDRYIDGEERQENSLSNINASMRNHMNGDAAAKRPPRGQCTAPVSPSQGRKQKPKSQSFREARGSQLAVPSRDWTGNGFSRESPRKLAKQVVERLSQSRFLPTSRSKEFDHDAPITIEDIYGGNLSRTSSTYSDDGSPKTCTRVGPSKNANGYDCEEILGSSEKHSLRYEDEIVNNVEAIDDIDLELFRKYKEAEDRVVFLSEELKQENYLKIRGVSVALLIEKIRSLSKENLNISLEVSAALQDQIAERVSHREELKVARGELEARTRRLEKEKNELQLTLEKELDRRSNEWSLKLEKYQAEEHRLRERVRELAEQNVSLQREASSFTEKELDNKTRITHLEQQFEDLTLKLKEASDENQYLEQNFNELQEKFRAAEEDRDCIRRNYEEKMIECRDLHRSVSRLQRTCNEQDKSLEGLRGLCEELGKKLSSETLDNRLRKLQMEQIRLTGVEHALRKEVDSYKVEVDALRHENINLLHRLKNSGKEGTFPSFKLDLELQNRIRYLQDHCLFLLAESSQLSRKLLECMKADARHTSENMQAIHMGYDSQLIVECDVKLQGFERATENLRRTLQTMAMVLHEKSNPTEMATQMPSSGNESYKLKNLKSEDKILSELKAETLLTSVLREKLYSKELDIEQLQAELAAAVRGNDVLKCEVQSALDNLSCMTHKMKDLEFQMIKKDENTNQLQNELQECKKELGIVRGILPKVSEERDLMWKEVKQYSEKNMLLNAEMNVLKKKIEALDEDILLKEGQITILKDSLGKPFDLLASP